VSFFSKYAFLFINQTTNFVFDFSWKGLILWKLGIQSVENILDNSKQQTPVPAQSSSGTTKKWKSAASLSSGSSSRLRESSVSGEEVGTEEDDDTIDERGGVPYSVVSDRSRHYVPDLSYASESTDGV
jgi:hypothetical protein